VQHGRAPAAIRLHSGRAESELEVEHDDPLERRSDPGRRGLVLGMRTVGVEAGAIQEVHGEAMGEATAAKLGADVLAPVEVDQAWDWTDQCAERDAAGLDLCRGGVGTCLQDEDVPNHGLASIPKPLSVPASAVRSPVAAARAPVVGKLDRRGA